MKESSFYKDKEGLMRCKDCWDYVCWMQNKAGKWYLGNAHKYVKNESSRHEERLVAVAVPDKVKVPHFASCRGVWNPEKECYEKKEEGK
jgi:hypothetical protein